MQKLESDLEVQVFDRSGHRVKLTAAGQTLLSEGRRILHAVDELEYRAKRIEKGWETELQIALDVMLPFSLLLPYIEAFRGERCMTTLKFSNKVLGGALDAVVTGRADLAIGSVETPLSISGISTVPIGELKLVFAVAPGHPSFG